MDSKKQNVDITTFNYEGRVCLQFGINRLDFTHQEARTIATNMLKLSNELKRENIKPKAK